MIKYWHILLEGNMKNVLPVIVSILVAAFSSCALQDASSSSAGAPAVHTSTLLPYSELAQGVYISGSLLFDPTDPEWNQVVPDTTIRFRLDRTVTSDPARNPYKYGVMRVLSVDAGGLTVEYRVYDNSGNIVKESPSLTLLPGVKVSLDGDSYADVVYTPVTNLTAHFRRGFEDTMALSFICDRESKTRSLYMVSFHDYPEMDPPAGILNLNPSGSIVHDMRYYAPISETSNSVTYSATVIPDVSRGDYLLDYTSGRMLCITRVLTNAPGQLQFELTASSAQNAYDNMFINIKGDDKSIRNRYFSSRRLASVRQNASSFGYLINENREYSFMDTPELGLAMDFVLMLGYETEAYLDINIFGGYIKGRLMYVFIAENSLKLKAWISRQWNYNQETELFRLPPLYIPIAPPVFLSLGLSANAGYNVGAAISGNFLMGYQIGGRIGYDANINLDFANFNVRNLTSFKGINTMQFALIPPAFNLRGEVYIEPYITIIPQLGLMDIINVSCPITYYLKNSLSGNIIYTPTNKSGYIGVDVSRRVTIGLSGNFGIASLRITFPQQVLIDSGYKSLYSWRWPGSAGIGEPERPTGLSLLPQGNGAIKLSWNKCTNAAGYYVYRATNAAGPFATNYVTANSYVDTYKLITNTTYYYYIAGVNDNSYGLPSVTNSVIPTGPNTPSGVAATPQGDGTILVTWNPTTTAYQYKVYRGLNPGTMDYVRTVTTNRLLDTELKQGNTYYYTIVTVNYAAESAQSAMVSANPQPPAQVSGLSLKYLSPSRASINWAPVSQAIGYIVKRSATPGGLPNLQVTVSGTNFDDTLVTAGASNFYTVSATNLIAAGLASAPLGLKVPSISDLYAEITSPNDGYLTFNNTNNIILHGNASIAPGIGVNEVYIAIDNINNYRKVTGTLSWSTNITDLLPGIHNIYVYAVDDFMNTSSTNRITITICQPMILFDVQGGSIISNQLLDYYSYGIEPIQPKKTGYLFGGWYTDTGYTNIWNFNTRIVTNAVTIYAKWNTYNYNVIFDSQGATILANPTNKYVTSPFTTVVSLPSAPSMNSFVFEGWFTKQNGEGDYFDENSIIISNMKVYAYMTTSITNFTFTNISNKIKILDYRVVQPWHCVIPKMISNKPVTMLSYSVFFGTQVTNVILPKTLEYIGQAAFQGTHIKNIVIPYSVTNIDDFAFSDCTLLTNVIFENKDCEIFDSLYTGTRVFLNCSVTVTAPAGGTVQAYCTANGIPFQAY